MNTEDNFHYQPPTLKLFLTEHIEDIRRKLDMSKGKIEEADFNSLEAELNEKCEELVYLAEDDTRLLLLKREIGLLEENVEAAAVKRRWYTKVPMTVWFEIILLPVVVYIVVVASLQRHNQDLIQTYASQTAVTTQAAGPIAGQTAVYTPMPSE